MVQILNMHTSSILIRTLPKRTNRVTLMPHMEKRYAGSGLIFQRKRAKL